MITLFQFGNSVCCQKVRITLAHKRLPFETVEINLFRNEQYDPAYLKLNPKGVVPTIIHDGQPINESTLICEYLDDVYPDPSLVPEDPLLRAHMRLWSKMVDEGLHEGISEISFCAMFRDRMRNMTPEQREARFENIGDPRRRDRFSSTYAEGTASPFVLYSIASYEKAFKLLEQTLTAGGPWVLGDEISLADINLMPYVARLDYLGLLDIWIKERPHVGAWWSAVQAWPAYRAGIADPMSETEVGEMRNSGPKIYGKIEHLLSELKTKQARLAVSH